MKVIDFMRDHIGKPVNLGFKSSFVYCDIVSKDIGEILAHLSFDWLTHEMDLLHNGIEAHDRLVTKGVNKYTDMEVMRWIAKHRTYENPDPTCPGK